MPPVQRRIISGLQSGQWPPDFSPAATQCSLSTYVDNGQAATHTVERQAGCATVGYAAHCPYACLHSNAIISEPFFLRNIQKIRNRSRLDQFQSSQCIGLMLGKFVTKDEAFPIQGHRVIQPRKF